MASTNLRVEGGGRWASGVTDKFFAPELSQFTAADIPDVSDVDAQRKHWMANYLLNSVLRGSYSSPAREQIYNFLRRSQAAFADYEQARVATGRFLADRHRAITSYVAAVGHWEDFLAHMWQADLFLAKVVAPGDKKFLFEKGDGSVNERVNSLYNRAKHADEHILAGKVVGESPLCVWLTNDGLRSTDARLTYHEAAEELAGLAQWAGILDDPRAAREKLEAITDDQAQPGPDPN